MSDLKALPPHIHDHITDGGKVTVYLADRDPGFRFTWENLDPGVRVTINTISIRRGDRKGTLHITVVGDPFQKDAKVVFVVMEPNDPGYEKMVQLAKEELLQGITLGDILGFALLPAFLQFKQAAPTKSEYEVARSLIEKEKWNARCICHLGDDCGVNRAIKQLLNERWNATTTSSMEADIRRIVHDENVNQTVAIQHKHGQQMQSLVEVFRGMIKNSPANRIAQAAINVSEAILIAIAAISILYFVSHYFLYVLIALAIPYVALFIYRTIWPNENERKTDNLWHIIGPNNVGSRFGFLIRRLVANFKTKND